LSQRMVHWETDWKLDGGCHQSVQEFPESLWHLTSCCDEL
jgi:hypothetical protein